MTTINVERLQEHGATVVFTVGESGEVSGLVDSISDDGTQLSVSIHDDNLPDEVQGEHELTASDVKSITYGDE